jgi:hypothetical protein
MLILIEKQKSFYAAYAFIDYEHAIRGDEPIAHCCDQDLSAAYALAYRSGMNLAKSLAKADLDADAGAADFDFRDRCIAMLKEEAAKC